LVEIRPLTSEELDDFIGFMEGPAFETNPQWVGCYCQFYLNAPEEQPSEADRATVNRKSACDRINSKRMNGYLAYEGEEVIGWVAANKASHFVALPQTEESVARILCFIVSEAHQGKGVATKLLNFAIADLKAKGFKSIEAAPRAAEDFASSGYRGKLSSFLKAGFEAGSMVDEQHILVHMNFTA
jgi:ribosomal protein S18 acetylase RimI-like enzyme